MKDLLIIVPIGIIIGIIFIYLKYQRTNSENVKVNQRISNKTKYQITSQSLSTSQSVYHKIENNKLQNEKQIQDRQSPQKVDNFNSKQNHKAKSRILSLDQRQNQGRINQQDSQGSRVKFRDDMRDLQLQQLNQKIEYVPYRNEPQQNKKEEQQILKLRQSQERQIEDQKAVIQNQNQSALTNSAIVQQKIFNLYNISCRVRNYDTKFLGPEIISQNYDDLFIDKNTKQQLNLFLKGYRQVRGDGNCYFTAIAFQYFEILLNKFSNLEFKEFMSQILLMSFQIQYHDYFIEDPLQNMCAQRLVQLLSKLRDKPQNLESMMADPNQEFYGLAIIFFRNLAQYLYIQYNSQIIDEYKPDLSNELLTWEFQCNDSEMINSSLAKYLNIIINVYLIDQKKSEVTQLNYGKQSKNQIHLIYIPGHYDIGIPI
ncbi:unnamed protein product [Paramecium pentaurelia]|uniref:OTU domain-containing protein n=1 Tax=Paramecium pentaurelia TaxID=43138 RepID=A0A8S1U207_9CILI|nr:unnamed protein product [Paramecium pentaurelia]